ncbi:hypothetical protein BO94DRAFT_584372 [Aspergillus sclerotioniger CBS 115572]|uniref:SnoaL-like domain-containing protein n=1 Tax=Aspergillus sclerotioniger CBS 115572 TaxID=1450535 RepID=A0A317X1E1_9EURO|nr:hypothetical protein BO94DRAFT_584372 [Aspergillus sclerotioniger CBS 115572]PWY90360.1 hypothetical protein BO94DRAFT_584372 [Aspergillus sclerotioniger CBS 115572]
MNLKPRATTFLTTLVNSRETASIEHLLHPNITLQHNDLPPMSKSELIAFWPEVLAQSPNFRVQVRDVIQEGNKVWVYSRVEGRLGMGVMDDVHMLVFDEEGLMVRCRGVQRVVEGEGKHSVEEESKGKESEICEGGGLM